VVVNHEKSLHIMFCGSAEFYIMNNLWSHLLSFQNGSTMPNPKSNPIPCNCYPQGVGFFYSPSHDTGVHYPCAESTSVSCNQSQQVPFVVGFR
jgi:hypothetical protein